MKIFGGFLDSAAGSLRTPTAHAAGGFTLLEILVAVFILAIALSAVLAGTARHADNAGYLRDRTLAMWVAHNRLTEIELEPQWPEVGKSEGSIGMAGVEWHWDVQVSGTQDPSLRRVDIQVQAPGREGDAATLSSFLSNLGRQE